MLVNECHYWSDATITFSPTFMGLLIEFDWSESVVGPGVGRDMCLPVTCLYGINEKASARDTKICDDL